MIQPLKMLAAMRKNPRDWRIGDLLAVATHCAIACRNDGGSHHVFGFPGVALKVCVPTHRPIRPVYVRQFLLLVDAVKELPQ